METSIEFLLYLVALARILVVFLRIHRKSKRKRQAKACDRSGQPVVYRTLAKTADEWLSRIHFILLQLDRLLLTAVYCNRREVQRQHLKDPFSRCEICKNFGIQIELTMTGQSRTTTSRSKELCTWNCVCVVK